MIIHHVYGVVCRQDKSNECELDSRFDPDPTVVLLTCTEVMEPFLVVVILSCILPMSVAKVG